MSGQRSVRLRVLDVVAETPDARSVLFAVPEDHDGRFDYRPGQFLTVRIPSDRTGSVARCYSLSSSPDTDDHLRVTVKRTEGGYGSNWICDHLEPGATLDVLPPSGTFTPASPGRDLLLFAGGSGITPVLSIVKTALTRGEGRITLVYANRDERSVIFADELQRLTEKNPERLTVLHWLESVQGLPTTGMLRALAAPYPDRDTFVCGPRPYMTAVRQALRELGTPRERVHVEKFVSLLANPFETGEPVTEPEVDDGDAAVPGPAEPDASVTVTLDGRTYTYPWPRDTKLLDLLLAEGLDAPFSCRAGQCSACACRLSSGEVRMSNNEILDDTDLADGIRLACQSHPASDSVEISYE